MTSTRQLYEQQPNLSVVPPKKDWPTMYDLPSEDPEEPGLPDEFHWFQPQLLSETLRLPTVPSDQVFTGCDLNLYYDQNNKLWYKRPDWFAVAGVPRFYDGHDLRFSYVAWDEQVNPFIIVELLSPATAKSDFGEDETEPDEAPTKWQVYEEILKVPYYVVFDGRTLIEGDRYEESLRVYKLVDGEYQSQRVSAGRYWLDEMGIGLGVWYGEFKEKSKHWLRWYDADGNWHHTETEEERQLRLAAESRAEQAEHQAEQERSRADEEQSLRSQAEQRAEEERSQRQASDLRAEAESRRAEEERSRADRLAQRLRELGVDPDEG